MEIRSFRGDAVVMASGGNGLIFGKSTMSVICTGGATSRCFQAGATYANGEFMQVHPSAIPGEDKCRLISESARGEGGRVWVPRTQGDERVPSTIPEAERWYFLEERYPKYGNLVPRDIATREVFQTCLDGYGVGGGNMVYLDLRDQVQKIGRDGVMKKLAGILEIYEKFVGTDPLEEPMKIFPAIHYSMGGLYTQFKKDDKTGGLAFGDPLNMQTSIPGLYAMGEANVQYHGANRLGANSLLSCIFDGLFGGTGIKNYANDVGPSSEDVPASVYEAVVQQETARMDKLIHSDGDENPYLLWQDMGREMTENCTVVRYNDRLDKTLASCRDWKARYERVKLSDTGMWTNQNLSFARAVRDMIALAEAIVKGARLRDESRGAHYKPDFPERDDDNFLHASFARYDAERDEAFVEPGADRHLADPAAQADLRQGRGREGGHGRRQADRRGQNRQRQPRPKQHGRRDGVGVTATDGYSSTWKMLTMMAMTPAAIAKILRMPPRLAGEMAATAPINPKTIAPTASTGSKPSVKKISTTQMMAMIAEML